MVVLVLKTEVGCDSAVPYVEEHYSPHLEHLLAADEFERCKEELEALIKASFPETACFSLNSGCGYFSLIATGLFVGYLVGKTTCSPSDCFFRRFCTKKNMSQRLHRQSTTETRRISAKTSWRYIPVYPYSWAFWTDPKSVHDWNQTPKLRRRFLVHKRSVWISIVKAMSSVCFTRDPYGSLLLRQRRQFASKGGLHLSWEHTTF